MGQSTFPVPSTGSSTSTVLPVNASSVILDGSLTSGTSYTTTVNGNGGIAYLTATDNLAIITISGTTYNVSPNFVVASKAFGASTSVTVACNLNTFSWSGVTYGNGYYVAVALSTTAAAYSTNGTTWTTSTMPSTSYWCSVTYGLVSATPTFVAVQQAGTTAGAYSTNGTSWTASTMSSTSYWTAVTYGNGYFVTVAYPNVGAYSTNGSTWTASTLPSSQNWGPVAYGLISSTNYYVAVSQGSTAGAYSTNGTSWTASTMPSAQYWQAVAYGNGKFVAVSQSTTAAAYSSNGTTWTASTMPSSSTWYGVAYGNGYFVAVATGPTTAGAYSTNGTSWTASTMPSTSFWTAVTYGLVGATPTFVAVSQSTTAGAYSTNGTTWTASTMPSTPIIPVNFGIYAGPTTIN